MYSKETSDYMIEISGEFVKEIKKNLDDEKNKAKKENRRAEKENEDDA